MFRQIGRRKVVKEVVEGCKNGIPDEVGPRDRLWTVEGRVEGDRKRRGAEAGRENREKGKRARICQLRYSSAERISRPTFSSSKATAGSLGSARRRET
jgi:hypothetical protein